MEQEQKEHEGHGECHEEELISRRAYLVSLKKWSKVVIGGVLLGGALAGSTQDAQAAAWVNRRGGAWADGGGSWANRRGVGGWADR